MAQTTALAPNRRGFLGMLFGAAAAVVASPLVPAFVERVLESKYGALIRKLRSTAQMNPIVRPRAFGYGAIADAFANVERWDLRVTDIYLRNEDLMSLPDREKLISYTESGMSIWGGQVHLTDDVYPGEAFVVGDGPDARGVGIVCVQTQAEPEYSVLHPASPEYQAVLRASVGLPPRRSYHRRLS